MDSTRARISAKQIKAKPKQNQTYLLGFVWWNLDLSKGYGRKKQKVISRPDSRLRLHAVSPAPAFADPAPSEGFILTI
jgi:hypothetical protein